MKVSSLFSRVRPISVFAPHLLDLGEVFLSEARKALEVAPVMDLHQEGFYSLADACIAAPAGGRSDSAQASDAAFFRELKDSLVRVCQQQGISTFSGIPATTAQGCAAGLRLARHFRAIGQSALADALVAGVAYAQDQTFPGALRLACFDGRMDFSSGRPVPLAAAVAENQRILAQGLCIGFEISDRLLAGQVDGNLDLQHTGASTRGIVPLPQGADRSWSATRWAVELVKMGWTIPGGSTLACYRADLDALAAMAVFAGRFTSSELERPDITERLNMIDRVDNFKTSGPWAPQRPFTPDSPWGDVGDSSVSEVRQLVAANAVAQDSAIPLERRVAIVAYWLRYGEQFVGGPAELAAARQKVDADRLKMLASVRPEIRNGVCIIESAYQGLFSVAYRHAPIGLVYNPRFQGFGAQKWTNPGMKYTIGAWGGQWLTRSERQGETVTFPAFTALTAALNAADPAAGSGNYWGGNAASGILGSPQGCPSGLTPEQVLGILLKIKATFDR